MSAEENGIGRQSGGWFRSRWFAASGFFALGTEPDEFAVGEDMGVLVTELVAVDATNNEERLDESENGKEQRRGSVLPFEIAVVKETSVDFFAERRSGG